MNTALITVEIPPFEERSLWQWGLENLSSDYNIDLVAISDREQFGQGEFSAGTVHLLNVFADPETEWTRRELTEFSVKAYVYISKLHRRESYSRFVVADAAGVEPLLAANLSCLAPVWVVEPVRADAGLEGRGDDLLGLADRRLNRRDLSGAFGADTWPPDRDRLRSLFDELFQ
ncbi:MAG: hypothetical protein ABEK50_11690 [bacterium]